MAFASFSESTVSMTARLGVAAGKELASDNRLRLQSKLTDKLVHFVGLQVTDQVPLDLWTLGLDVRISGLGDELLNVVLSEHPLPVTVGLDDGLLGVKLADSHQSDGSRDGLGEPCDHTIREEEGRDLRATSDGSRDPVTHAIQSGCDAVTVTRHPRVS